MSRVSAEGPSPSRPARGELGVEQLAEGLWRWTAWHDEWRHQVGSVFLETEEAICLFDPIVPSEEEQRARFWRALDRDVARILDVPVTLRGFSAPDVTLAGFGLSRWGEFRDLPHVATVMAEDA